MKYLCCLFLVCAAPAAALDLSLPNGTVVAADTSPARQIRLPQTPWSPNAAPFIAEGQIDRQVLRVGSGALTSLQLINALRDPLDQAGYTEVFSCSDTACGGFDFRFQLDIIGEPDMHVDLGDFMYVLFQAPEDGADPNTVALLASRTQSAGFVHVTQVSDPQATPETVVVNVPDTPGPVLESGDLITNLRQSGHAILSDLDFETGSSDLGIGPYESLSDLAAWLGDNPSARVVLVGHTDSVGSLDANTALSQRRATSVMRFMVNELGTVPDQVQASGAGFLAPIASNLTEEGRAANRRVEVVLLSIDQ